MPHWTKRRARILIADDHPLIADGITTLLHTDFEVVGIAADGRQLVEKAERLQPDVVTLDIGMPKLNGLEAAKQLRKLLPRVKLVFVTQQVDLRFLKAALAAGANAYVAKQSASSEVLTAVRKAYAGGTFITPDLEASYLASLPAKANHSGPAETLTRRQHEVLQLIAEGHSAKSIAKTLDISRKTVDFHREQLKTTLGIRTTAELTRYAIAQGIVHA